MMTGWGWAVAAAVVVALTGVVVVVCAMWSVTDDPYDPYDDGRS